jgi:hypothetical protein
VTICDRLGRDGQGYGIYARTRIRVSIFHITCAIWTNVTDCNNLLTLDLGRLSRLLATGTNDPDTHNTQHIMTNLERALSLRFTDSSEIRDVANHGCQGGVSDFIYSSELFEFFNEHESDIEDILEQLEVPLTQLVKDEEYWTMQELRESAVWIVVEYYCQGIVDAYAVA